MKDEIIVYHGTRANPDSIREKGLLAGGLDREVDDPMTEKYVVNKEATLRRVLAEFGYTDKSEVPEWTYRGELQYEENEPIHIHFEMNYENARGYSGMGGEPAYCIRRNIMVWQELTKWHILKDVPMDDGQDWSVAPEGLRQKISEAAKLVNGSRCFVVAVKLALDDPRLDRRAVETILRVRRLMEEGKLRSDYWQRGAFEVRYYGDIRPADILGIVEVEPPRFGE